MELEAKSRDVFRKKVRFLRRQGLTPVNVIGHKVDPMSLQCDTKTLQQVLGQAGQTGLITMKIDNTKQPRNVMVREIQRDPLTRQLLHVDFYQVRMDVKVRVEVPIVTIGEAPALKMSENYLSHELNTLTIECLPEAMPNRIEVDVSTLEEADQTIHVQDINLDEELTILNTPDQLVVRISTHFIESEADVVASAEIVEGETAEEAPADGAADGESSSES
ncbi:50S ribosomal protein L25 [Chloroflexota bacterium]